MQLVCLFLCGIYVPKTPRRRCRVRKLAMRRHKMSCNVAQSFVFPFSPLQVVLSGSLFVPRHGKAKQNAQTAQPFFVHCKNAFQLFFNGSNVSGNRAIGMRTSKFFVFFVQNFFALSPKNDICCKSKFLLLFLTNNVSYFS